MPQIFHPSTNTIAKLSIVAVVLGVPAIGVASYAFNLSYGINLNVPLDQPVQFSHKHHVGDDGIDCRYCHTSVAISAVARIPPTKSCMNCHSVLFSNAGYLDPVRESYRTDTSIEWVKVHRLADFVYFNHSIHVNKVVGCTTCHGPIDQMPLVFQASTLLMQWCVDCHRNPAPNLRPMDKVFAMDWKPGADQEELGQKFMEERKIRTAAELTSCSTCHR